MYDFLLRQKRKRMLKKRFCSICGYKPRLLFPKTYCEKIQWCKLHHNHHSQHVITRSDKLAVREVIKQLGYSHLLLQHYGHWDNAKHIDWQKLPSKFVLKINNRSSDRYLWKVEDKSQLDLESFTLELNQKLAESYGLDHCEYHYEKIPNRLFAEHYLEDDNPLKDYKFYCFNGVVDFFSIEIKQPLSLMSRSYHNPDFSIANISFYRDLNPPKQPFSPPENLEHMITIAEILSEDYPHVRVDLYNVCGKIFFGELTYVPESGYTQWKPKSLDRYYGDKINLGKLR